MALDKARKQINDLIEKVTVVPPDEKDISTIPDVSITVDASDDANIQFSPRSEPKKESSDTVYGQGTPPNPEDETYLSLLKGTVVGKKVKVKTEKEDDKIEVKVNRNPTQPNPDLNPSYYSGPKPK